MTMACIESDTAAVDDCDLSGQKIAHKPCADGVQRTGLGCKYDLAVIGLAVTQRSKSVRIARGDQLLRRADDQRIRALYHIHRRRHRLFNRTVTQSFLHDRIGDNFGIGSGMEDRALFLIARPQRIRIGQIAVVAQRHPTLVMVDDQRLDVLQELRAGGGIAHMTDRNIPFAQRAQIIRAEHLADQSLAFLIGEHAVVVDDDSRALLTAVL